MNKQNVLNTAVLLITYKRLDTTTQVFEAIRKAKPRRLYISSNSGKNDEENESVNKVREFLEQNIDWECKVDKLYRKAHLSAKLSISGAITWFFDNEEQGIILEDDCLPSQSFFWFCEELLVRYKEDMRVWHIGGSSTLQDNILTNEYSYYFSKFNHIWGWATWASRWGKYDINLSSLDEFTNGKYIENISNDKLLQKFWLSNFRNVCEGRVDTWDYQWYYTTWTNGGGAIIPTTNLISNIGFGEGATHTSDVEHKLANMPAGNVDFDLVHPNIMMPNALYDKYNAKFLFDLNYFVFYKNKIKKLIKIIRKVKK